MNRKTTVVIGILVFSMVAGVAGTATALSSSDGVAVNQTSGEVEIIIVNPGNADSVSLISPNGKRSAEFPRLQAGTVITIVETPENRTVPDENYFATGATKTERQTCWVRHGGLELGNSIKVNHSVNIPCNGGEIAGSENLDPVGQSNETVFIEPGQKIEYREGTYEVRFGFNNEEKVTETFTVRPEDTDSEYLPGFSVSTTLTALLTGLAGRYTLKTYETQFSRGK